MYNLFVIDIYTYIPGIVVTNNSLEPFDLSRKYEKVHFLPGPLFFVSKGSHETTVGENELMMRKNIAYW